MTQPARYGFAILALTLTLAAQQIPLYRPPGFRNSPPVDLTWRLSIHNTFWHGIASNDAGASGPKQHLGDDLYIDRARGLEFDMLANHGGRYFSVYHTNNEGYSLCRLLTSCPWRIDKIRLRLESGTTPDNAAAT